MRGDGRIRTPRRQSRRDRGAAGAPPRPRQARPARPLRLRGRLPVALNSASTSRPHSAACRGFRRSRALCALEPSVFRVQPALGQRRLPQQRVEASVGPPVRVDGLSLGIIALQPSRRALHLPAHRPPRNSAPTPSTTNRSTAQATAGPCPCPRRTQHATIPGVPRAPHPRLIRAGWPAAARPLALRYNARWPAPAPAPAPPEAGPRHAPAARDESNLAAHCVLHADPGY